MTDNIYKEGSKLHAVYAVFLKDGVEAAFKHGIETLGMSPSTMKIQSKRWGINGEVPKVATPKKPKAARPEAMKPVKDQKCFTIAPRGVRTCTIVEAGPEASVIRWLDNGREECVPNNWLHPTTPPKKDAE